MCKQLSLCLIKWFTSDYQILNHRAVISLSAESLNQVESTPSVSLNSWLDVLIRNSLLRAELAQPTIK